MGRNEPCWCGSGIKWKKCHYPDLGRSKRDFTELKNLYKKKYQILLKTKEEIEGIRKACQISSQILEATAARAKEGVTTEDLDAFAADMHKQLNATAACLHYGNPPFPKSICTSVNEVICHGIPDKTPLKKGDIVNIDIASIYQGFFGDCSKMVVIGGKTDPERQRVVDVSYDCLMKAIAVCKPDVMIHEIGKTIETYAESQNCSVVFQFVGHGVGLSFHENPQVHHHFVPQAIPLAPGMTFTIEPMINAGVAEGVIDETNMWTVTTLDGLPSAQWEHTILITENGHEILTTWKR